jgi:5-methylcytosine-specific restriction endonuclease McrA
MSPISPMQREAVEPTPRKSFTPKQRIETLLAFRGRCAKCGEKIPDGGFQINHIKPLHDGGAHAPDNWEPVHIDCHKVISAGQAKARAKSDRLRLKNLPADEHPQPARKLQGKAFPKSRWDRLSVPDGEGAGG